METEQNKEGFTTWLVDPNIFHCYLCGRPSLMYGWYQKSNIM